MRRESEFSAASLARSSSSGSADGGPPSPRRASSLVRLWLDNLVFSFVLLRSYVFVVKVLLRSSHCRIFETSVFIAIMSQGIAVNLFPITYAAGVSVITGVVILFGNKPQYNAIASSSRAIVSASAMVFQDWGHSNAHAANTNASVADTAASQSQRLTHAWGIAQDRDWLLSSAPVVKVTRITCWPT